MVHTNHGFLSILYKNFANLQLAVMNMVIML